MRFSNILFYPSIELNCFLLLFSPLFLSHKTTTLKQNVAVKSSDLNFFFPFQFISYFYYQLLQTKPANESSVLGGKEQLNLFPHKFHLHRYTETKTQTDCNNQLQLICQSRRRAFYMFTCCCCCQREREKAQNTPHTNTHKNVYM